MEHFLENVCSFATIVACCVYTYSYIRTYRVYVKADNLIEMHRVKSTVDWCRL